MLSSDDVFSECFVYRVVSLGGWFDSIRTRLLMAVLKMPVPSRPPSAEV